MNVWIGTSGYSYQDWVGDFYPPNTSPARMLPRYCEYFPLVELNFTFYRPPTRPMLLRLADKTPAGFQFIVKLPQTISHEESPRDLPDFQYAAEGLQQRGQLAGLLCQFPQACHCTRKTCDWIATLARALGHLGLAVEFRHRSWNRPGLSSWRAEQGVHLVAVDAPDLPGLFPRGWAQSTSTAYIRLHSRNADNWYRSGEARYDYDYSDAELSEWAEAMVHHQEMGDTQRTLLLFNNCQRSQAALNARRMQRLLEQVAPQLNVIAPLAEPPPRQRTLWE